MTAKDWLFRAWRLQDEIDALETSRQEALDKLTNITPRYDGNGGGTVSPDPHKFDYIAAYISQIEERQRQLVETKSEILSTINRVSNSQIRAILISRYINCEQFEKIAFESGMSFRHVIRLHGYGLLEIKKLAGL